MSGKTQTENRGVEKITAKGIWRQDQEWHLLLMPDRANSNEFFYIYKKHKNIKLWEKSYKDGKTLTLKTIK